MKIFGNDLILGDFRLSDYGLILADFDTDGNLDESLSIDTSTIEEFIGNNPVPVYLGDRYTEKLKPTFTVIKDPGIWNNETTFYEKDCRALLRMLTGINGYQWMKVYSFNDSEDIWFRAKIINVSYKKLDGKVVGLIFNMECDSFYGWSVENTIYIHANAGKPFYIFNNTDDLQNFVYPVVAITSPNGGTIHIENKTENWITEIDNVSVNEKITIDSKYEIITSNMSHDLLLNDFNLGWPRLVPDKNEYMTDTDLIINFKFRVPRKVGFIE